jgi:penicillin amidase
MAIKERPAAPGPAPPGRRRRPLWKILLLVLGGIVLVVVLLAVGALTWLIRSPLPTTSGTVRIPGLSAPVTVVRDKTGIPHITAANMADLFKAQGYVVAQDRLWQMDFYRRVGAGRLSEVLGETTLDTDRFIRTVGWRRAAQKELDMLPESFKAILQDYADGVNTFIDTHHDSLPIEFTLLGYKPDPWTPLDSVTFGKVMAWDLSGNMDEEETLADLQARLGVARAAELLPDYPDGGTTIVQQSALPGNPLGRAPGPLRLSGVFGTDDTFGLIGSNNWVVDGSRSASGHPLLANDPHLGVQNPSIWYAVQLHAADDSFDAEGVTFAGAPGIVVGHNRDIVWGVTNLGPDTQDLFVETLDPAGHPGQYQFQGQWLPLDILTETITIKGAPPEPLVVRTTRHGPLLNDVDSSLTKPTALQWTALQPGGLLPAVLNLDRATNWDEFHQALLTWDVPGQNFVYADTKGNIGYQATGRWPIRKKGDGQVPVDGASGAYEWTGFVPYDEMPRVYNPPDHYIVTANNRVVGPDYPYLIKARWGAWFRADRIAQMITAKPKLTMDDIKAIHYDTHDLQAVEIARYLAAAGGSDPSTQQAAALFQNWDGNISAGGPTAALYEITYGQVMTNTFADDLGGTLAAGYLGTLRDESAILLNQLVADPSNAWWDDIRTPQHETRDDILRKSLQDAVGILTAAQGGDRTKWSWGALHTITFAHTLGVAKPLDRLLNIGSYPMPGDAYTVATGGYAENKDSPHTYRQTNHPSMRMINDTGDWDQMQLIFAPGESGQVGSSHWDDQVAGWLHGQYRTIPWSPAAVQQATDATLTLAP